MVKCSKDPSVALQGPPVMARQPLQIQTEVRNQKPNILLHAQIFWISSQTRQRQWEKSVIFLQEILLLRIEKSFYISHWKSVALFRMSALWLIVRVRISDASFEI